MRVSPRFQATKVTVLIALFVVAACGGSVAPQGSNSSDGGGGNDGASTDGAKTVDGGSSADAGALDSSPTDSGQTDTSMAIDSAATDSGIASDGGGGVPTNHRPDDSECLGPAPAGDCQGQGGQGPVGGCMTDSQCTMGVNGRCNENGPIPGCSCSYDSCTDDSSCPNGQLCVCHGSAYTFGDGNSCMPGNCRVDSDCGKNGYCSPSAGVQNCGGVTGYYCHTTQDECVNDSDCSAQGPLDVCAWSATGNRWECQMQGVCAFAEGP